MNLFLSVLLCGLIYLPQSVANAAKKTDAAQAKQANADPPSLVSKVARDQKTPEDAARDRKKDNLNIWTTFGIVVASVVQATAAVIVVFVYRRQTEVMLSSLTAAREAAASAMAGQRAYVATTCYWLVNSTRHANARFGVTLRNVGHLPTIGLRNFIDYRIVDGELPNDFIFPDDAEPITSGSLLVPADQLRGPHIPRDTWVSNADLLAVKSGMRNVYLFGWIKYFDGFPDTPERITRFCYSVGVTGEEDPPFVFHPYRQYNNAE